MPTILSPVPSGLVSVETADVSEHTVARTLAWIQQELTEDYEALARRFGSQVVDRHTTVLPLLEAAGLGYGVVGATLPGY